MKHFLFLNVIKEYSKLFKKRKNSIEDNKGELLMNKTKNENIHIIMLYVIGALALTASILSLTGVFTQREENTDLEWECFYDECTEIVELTGEQWAQESCQITANGTICTSVNELGEPIQFYLEELLATTPLSEITASKCAKRVCLAEVPVREVNYEITINE